MRKTKESTPPSEIQEGKDVFISYSRKNQEFVKWLNAQFQQVGREPWIDWSGILPTEEWWPSILRGIDSANSYIFVISPDSVQSPVCQKEVEHAVASGKRIIPVVCQDVHGHEVHPDLAKLNYIFLRTEEEHGNLPKLFQALDTDLDHVQAHTKFLVRAREWEARAESGAYLLRGGLLHEADTWLSQVGGKLPAPTELHSRYILASRKAARRSQRVTMGAITSGLVLALGFAAVAYSQWQAAEERRYLSGIQAAAAELKSGNFDSARDTLTQLPSVRRRWEWFILAEWAGPPALRISDMAAWLERNRVAQPEITRQVAVALARLDRPTRGEFLESEDGASAIVLEKHGRHGSFAAVVAGDRESKSAILEVDLEALVVSKDPLLMVAMTTANYTHFDGLAFTPDGSLVVAKAELIHEYARPALGDLGDDQGAFYVIPVPRRLTPREPLVAEDDGGGIEHATLERLHFDGWYRHAITALSDDYSFVWPWHSGDGPVVVAPRDESEDEPGYSGIKPYFLPKLIRDHINEIIGTSTPAAQYSSKGFRNARETYSPASAGKRYLAAIKEVFGQCEGLFYHPASGCFERWNLEKKILIGELGQPCKEEEASGGSLDGRDLDSSEAEARTSDPDTKTELYYSAKTYWAAYNSTGTFVLAYPTIEGGVGIFDLTTGRMIESPPEIPTQVDDGFLRYGISPRAEHIFVSVFERPVVENRIFIARQSMTGYQLQGLSDEEGEFLTTFDKAAEGLLDRRFVAWSPDELWRFEVRDRTATLYAISRQDPHMSIPISNAVRVGPYPVFDELPQVAEPGPSGRFALGGLIFSRDSPVPILRLPLEWMDESMRSLVVKNSSRNFELLQGYLLPTARAHELTAAMRLQRWWIDTCDARRGGKMIFDRPNREKSTEVSAAVVSNLNNRSYYGKLMAQASICEELGRFLDAIDWYTKAMRLQPGSAEVFERRAWTYQALRRWKDALADYDHAIQLEPSKQEYRFLRHLAVISLNTEAIVQSKEAAAPYFERGKAYAATGHANLALSDLNEAIRLNCEVAEYHYERALLRKESGDTEEAVNDLSQAILIDPKHARGFYERGMLLQDIPGAIADFTSAIELQPDFFDAMYERGVKYALLDEDDKAIADFTAVIRMNPGHAEAFKHRCWSYKSVGDIERALADWGSVIRLEPDNTEHMRYLEILQTEARHP